MTKKETNLSGTLSEAVSVATSVAYTRQEIQKLKTELVSLLEKKTTELIVEQVPGPVGPRGALGATGAQGPKGDKGDKGDVGERGEKGEVGPQGNMGLDGPRGLKGDKGDKGEQGQVGPQGEQGIQGLAGERGPQGLKGDRGEDGKNGLDGKDGQAGAIGPVGPAGSQGVQGGQGPKGDKGERGRDGQQGVAGPAGPQGEIGPQGIQGVAGKDGKDGDIKPVEEKFQKFIDNVQRDVNSFKTKVNAAILKSGPNDAWKATGSGEVNLRYLDDIDRDSITDGYVLSYDSANAKFKFVEQGGGDGTDQWARDQANAAYNYANTLALESGTLDTTARTTANSAWYTANLAYVTANSAWATANSALNQQSGDIDPFARSQANSAFNQANLSYIVANNSWSTANASYIQANTGTTLAQAAYNYANTISLAGYAVNTTVNLVWSTANNAYAEANTARSIGQAAYDYANTLITGENAGTDNLARSIANSAFATANAAYNTANSAWTTANTQSDWNVSDNTSVAFIKNKPTLVTTLNDLSDATIVSPLNEQVLKYNTATGQWINQSIDISANNLTTGYFGGFFYNGANVALSNTSLAYTVPISGSYDGTNGVTIGGNNDILIAYAGTYHVEYSIQFENGGNADDDVDIWVRVNGVNVANSGSKFSINKKNNNDPGFLIAVTPFLLTCNTADRIQFEVASSTGHAKIASYPTQINPTTPAIPAVIVNVQQVSSIVIPNDIAGTANNANYLGGRAANTYATTATTNLIWSTANSATTLAQSAYDFANTIVSDTQIDPFARSQANSAFNQANTATSNAATANNQAASAFNKANTSTTLAQSAYDYANTIVVPSLSGYAVNTTVNLVWSTANSAYTQANTGTALAQAAYNQANTGLAKDYTLNTVTSNTSIANTDSRELFLCDTSNNVVLTMPAGNTVGDGFNFKVTRLGSGEVTLAGAYNNNVIRGIKFGDINFNFNTVYDEPLSAYENVLLDGEYKTSQLALSSFDNQTSFELVSISDTEYALVQGTVLPSGTQDFAIEDYNDLINTPDLSVYATTATTNTIATNVASAWSTANSAYTQANSALSIAQSAFAQANTGGAAGTDNVARSIANSAFSTANSAFAKANTGTSQLVNDASTVSLSANGNLTVPGPIIGLGNSKLDFTTYGSNSVYLTTTSDDSTALFMGLTSAELYAYTTVQIRTNTAGVSKNWTFGADGSTTLPGTVDITYTPDTATGSAITINGANTQGGTGYADFLKVTNTSGGATNPNKTFRLNSTGDLEIINSAYDANLFSLTNAGGLSVPGPISVGGKQAVNGPAFRAYVATGQAITSGSQQKVTFGTENFDTNGNFASSRFTPTIEGYYQFNATVRIDGTSSTGECMIILYKNGAEYARGHNQSGTEQGASFYSMTVSDIAYANGTSDYFEVYIQQSSGGNRNTTAGSPISYFSGVMVRGA